MSRVFIHPAVTREHKDLVALQQATGLAIDFGRRYLCLVPREGKPGPARETVVVHARRPGKATSYLQGPTRAAWPTPDGPNHPGGGSAA